VISIETIRLAFRPDRITTLFVGESAPISGDFFYCGGTALERVMRSAIEGSLGPTSGDFLGAFKAYGWYLDDLVLTPIDHLLEIILGKLVKADWPLTLEQAAKFVSYRLKRARTHLDNLPAFSTLRRELLDGKRKAELARNLMTAIEIRDDPGENSAADRTVRLKAIQVIEGSDGKASVTVNVNQQTNVERSSRAMPSGSVNSAASPPSSKSASR
jgi:hypothetical protein